MITVNVPGRTYRVHQSALVERAGYFKSMFTAGFLKPETVVNIEWRSAFALGDAFASALEYVYTREFLLKADLSDQRRCVHAAHVYVFADYLCMDELKDLALKSFEDALVVAEPSQGTWGFDPERRPLLLKPAAVVAIHQALYENPFDLDSPRASQEIHPQNERRKSTDSIEQTAQDADGSGVPQALECQGGILKVPKQEGETSKVLEHKGEILQAPEDEAKPVYTDPRNKAREAFVQCVAVNLTSLLQSRSCEDLFAKGGDFIVDLLRHQGRTGICGR